jgi:multidrug efflux pump
MVKALIAVYGRGLNWVLDRPVATLTTFALTVVLTVVAYLISPKGFFPLQDTGAVQVITEATQSTSFDAMAERQQALARLLLQDPAVQSLTSFIGVDGPNASLNAGRMTLNLVPKAPASRSTFGRATLRASCRLSQTSLRLAGVSAALARFEFGRPRARNPFRFLLSGPDGEALGYWSKRLQERLRLDPALADVASATTKTKACRPMCA